MKKIIIISSIVIVVLLIVIINLNKGKGGIKVQTERVSTGKIVETVSGAARIEPEEDVKISAKVSGQIMRLGVQEGDSVRKGDFLVQLDREYYRAAAEQARSNRDYAQAGFEKSKNEYLRYKKLHEDNLASQAELEIAKSTYEQAQASVKQASAALEQAEDNLAKTTIYAPMDGVVSQLNKKVGEMAMGSQFTLDVIMTVADLSRMQAVAEIDENDVVNVSMGDTTNISVDAFPDTTFKGTVTEIANTGTTRGQGTQEEITNFMVEIAMLEKPKRIRPGMSATVDIITDKRADVLKVPIQCITMRPPLPPKKKAETDSTQVEVKKEKKGFLAGLFNKKKKETKKDTTKKAQTKKSKKPKKPVKVIFVVKDGIAEQIEVETGISSDTEWQLLQGPDDNAEVISGPYRILSKQIKNGTKVKVDNSIKKRLEN